MKIWRGLGVVLALWPVLAWAAGQGSPFLGVWHWNKADSKTPPGEPPPAAMDLVFERADALHVRWTVTLTDATGRKTADTYDVPANGEFYPIDADTSAVFTLGSDSLKAVFRGPGGETDTMTCRLANAGARLVCTGEIASPDGNKADYVDVYDRG
jgi:hypothetical protein